MAIDLLTPGHIVMSKEKSEKLILWSTYRGESDDFFGVVDPNEIMIVLESKKTIPGEEQLTPEWENGAYLVMTSSGTKGWVGSGWVVSVC